MAENANARKQWARVLALGVILAGVLFTSSQVVQSQQAQPPVGQRPKSARDLFVEANDCHKRGDYERAAQLYGQVQGMKNRLNAVDQRELPVMIDKNNHAMKMRSDGAFLLVKAQEYLQQSPPNIKEAENNWSKAKAIPYTDPGMLEMVNQEIRAKSGKQPAPSNMQPFPGSPKAMLAEGRNTFRRALAQQTQEAFLKDMERAMTLAVQAKEAGFPKTLFPWQDNPDKLLKEIEREFAKPRTFTGDTQPSIPAAKKATFLDKLLHREPAPAPQPTPDKNNIGPNGKAGGNDGPLLVPMPEPGKEKTGKTESTSPFQSMKNFFGGGSKEKEKNPPDPNVKQVSKDNVEPEPKNPAPKEGFIKTVFGNKEKTPSDNKTPPKDATASANKPAIEVTGNVSLPTTRPPVDTKGNTAQARQLIQDGYKALQAKDYDTARRLALQARDLHPDLEWFEQNPDKLLIDIQKREPGSVAAGPTLTPVKATEPAATKVATTPAEKDEQAKAKAKELVTQGRELFKKNKLEEADKLCAQAAGIPGTKWGLFEDSPEKLRIDIQKARGHRDHEEAARLTTEARDLFKKGQYQEAKMKAWQAQKLHGPYSIWDLGDRPQKILADIEQAEGKKAGDANAKNMEPESKVTPKDNGNQIANAPNNNWTPKAPAESEAKTKARALVVEARALMQQGQLVPAREKAVAALNLRVVFNPGEDSPAAVLQDLGQMCVSHMDGYLKRAGDWMMNPGDPARVQKADADLNAARALAVAFQLDARAIDDRQNQIRQIATNAPVTPPLTQNNLTVAQKIGLDKLEKARQELRAGNLGIARRIAEDAFDPQYGVQQEAANVLRLIDAEEQNQYVVAALKTMQSGMDAFQRHDYLQARSILAGVDPRLLDPERQRILREILILPEMQEQRVQTMDSKAIASGLKQMSGTEPANAPGKARVDDMNRPGGDAAFASVRAMEDILFQKLYQESREAQNKAMAQIKSGQTTQAIETLRDYLGQLDRAQLEPERLTLIKKQIEKRMQDYRTLQAQTNIAKAGENLNSVSFNEGQHQKKILRTQEQIVEQMDQYRALMKEGKYKEAMLAALKAKELDPDNLAVIAALREASILRAQRDHDKIKEVNEQYFLDALNSDQGPVVNQNHPLDYNPERLANIDKNRKDWTKGIPSVNRNATEREIERKLNRPTSVSFQKTPLSTVVRDLQSLTGVNIVLDKAALDEANVLVDAPLSLSVENISLKCILNLLLREVHLTYVVKNEVLNITTENAAKGGFTQVVYPVSDLVTPVEDHPLPDVYDFQKLMAHHIANNGVNMSSASPVQGPFGLPGGQAVGSSTSGMNNPAGFSSSNDIARGRKTLEDQLIKLITSTIAPESWESMGGPGKIQYFPLGMSLVIAQQTQDVQEQVQDLLAALRRLQDLEVAIELRLVSVSEAFFEKIGVNFSMNIPIHNSQSIQDQLLRGQFQPAGLINTPFPPSLRGLTTGLTPAGTFTPDLGVPISSGSYAFSNPPFGGYPATSPGGGGIALGLAFLNDIQVAMFMEAAQGDRRTNIMQAPKITVFNGATASISVNTTQFFLLGVNLSTSPFGQLIMSPQQQPFALGVFLQVTPVVSADRRFVRMNMTPTMTNLVDATVPLIPLQIPVPSTFFGPGNGTTSGQQESIFTMFFQQPSISTITVNTTVNVPDGGTVLLGGLKTLSEGRNEFGPPVLSKIPYISRLFKNVAYGREAQSLMIMVTPRIIINEEEEMIFRGQLEPIPRP